MIALSNIAQGSAVFGMIMLQRKNAQAQEVNVPACISCYLGVTEPTIFGVNLKHVFPFVCGMIGSACAAVISVATGTTANAIGVGGLPGILSIQPKHMAGFEVSMSVAIVIPFVLTIAVGKKKLQKSDIGTTETFVIGNKASGTMTIANRVKELRAFLSGKVIDLKEVGDGVFSEGIVGDGFAYLVRQGEKVQAGTPLLKFDREKIKAANHPDTTVCVITEPAEGLKVRFMTGIKAAAGETIVAELEQEEVTQ